MQAEQLEAIELLPVMSPPLDFNADVDIDALSPTAPASPDASAGSAQMYRIVDDFCRVYRERQSMQKQAATVLGEALWRLVLAVGCRNRESPARGVRVGIYAALLADAIGSPEEYCDDLMQAALLRDIGMIGLQDQLGELPRILSPNEVGVMQSHAYLGSEMLGGGRIPDFSLAAEVALSHHERYDGTGYPQQLFACAIPLSGRIVAIAEYFERLTSERDYGLPLPDEDVTDLISSQWGTRFDPQLVVALLEIREVRQRVRQFYGEESIMLSDSAPERSVWRQFKSTGAEAADGLQPTAAVCPAPSVF